QEKAELERRLLEDVAAKSGTATSSRKTTNAFAYGVATFIPIGAIALYLVVGNPKGVNPSANPQTIPANAPDQPGMMSQQHSAAFQVNDYKKAVEYWQKLLTLLPAGSDELQTITAQISKAKELAAGKGSR